MMRAISVTAAPKHHFEIETDSEQYGNIDEARYIIRSDHRTFRPVYLFESGLIDLYEKLRELMEGEDGSVD